MGVRYGGTAVFACGIATVVVASMAGCAGPASSESSAAVDESVADGRAEGVDAFVAAVREQDYGAYSTGEAWFDDVTDDELVERGREICAETDAMTDDEFLRWLGVQFPATRTSGGMALITSAQGALCGTDHAEVLGVLLSPPDSLEDYSESDWHALRTMAGSDDLEDVFLWYLSVYDIPVDDDRLLQIGLWSCDRFASDTFAGSEAWNDLLADAVGSFDIDPAAVVFPVRFATLICPEWDDEVAAVQAASA